MNFMNNINNWNDMNNMNNLNQINSKYFIVVFIYARLNIIIEASSDETVNDLIEKFRAKVGIDRRELESSRYIFLFNDGKLDYNSKLTLAEAKIAGNKFPLEIKVIDQHVIIGGGSYADL